MPCMLVQPLFLKTLRVSIFCTAATLALASCSNGGSSSNSQARQQPSTAWQKNIYKGVDEFAAFCLRPDTSRGQQQGTVLHENHFIRELMNEIYLWREDITDVNPNTFANPLVAFMSLLSTEKTASGKNKDEFSGIMRYSDYIQRFVDGVELGIGANISTTHFSEDDNNKPLVLTIAYVEPHSPAAQAGLERGDKITAVNGQTTQSALDINAKRALFFAVVSPANTSTIALTIEKLGTGDRVNLNLSPAEVTINPVLTSDIIEQGTNKTGYLVFNTFTSDLVVAQLQAAFQNFNTAGVNELIVDLRYNGGGSIENAQRLAYMIAGEDNTKNKTFSRTQWNDRHPNFDPISSELLVDEIFIATEPDNLTPLASLDLNRVTVLTSSGTCSASELIMNALNGIDIEVVQIGDTTCGKPYGFYPIPNCEFVYFPVQFQAVNAKDFGDYADGFSAANGGATSNILLPGCTASDDLTRALGNTEETLLATALYYQAQNQCPKPSVATNKVTNKTKGQTHNAAAKPQFYQKNWETMAIKEVKR